MIVNKVLLMAFLMLCSGIGFSTPMYTDGKNATTVNEIPAITKGGQGGKIVKVTNLQSSGEGSFLDAVKMDGPRIIVFEVGGVIDLEKTRIIIDKPFVTIAGQTAPSPGITFIRGGISVTTHDVIIQHIMVRPGDAGEPKKSGWEPDGIATSGGNAYNILIDHCSVTWSVDENISASGPRLEGPENTSHKVTISNCLIAECLSNSTHAKGEHSKGSLIHDNCREITVQRNLFAHNKQRNPYFKTAATGIIANNLIYNPGTAAIHTHWVKSEWEGHPEPPTAKIAIAGNVLIPGTIQKSKPEIMRIYLFGITRDHAELFLRENYIENNASEIPLTAGTFIETDAPPFQPTGIMDTDKVTDYILTYAGARPADRDPIDQRIIDSVKKKQGRIIDSQNEVGGYPDYAPVYRKLNIPKENIQEWLDGMAREVEGNKL
jgi:pectate lyase